MLINFLNKIYIFKFAQCLFFSKQARGHGGSYLPLATRLPLLYDGAGVLGEEVA